MDFGSIKDWFWLLFWVFVLSWLLVTLGGCRAQKDTYQYDGNTYAEVVHDTAYIERTISEVVHDTAYIERHDSVRIEFADGGGMYDEKAGVWSGIASVTGVRISNESSSNSAERTEREAESTGKDSAVTQSAVTIQSESERKPARLWWLFPLGVVIGAGGIIALKKIPVTKTFMLWL